MGYVTKSEVIGNRRDGRVIWRYEGGSPEASEGTSGDESGGEGGGGGGDGSESEVTRLQRALDSERSLAKQARDAARPWRVLAQELGVKGPDEVRSRIKALSTEQERYAASIDEVRNEVTGKANARIVSAEIRAIAATDFADPMDAVLNLRASDYEVGDDGSVDERRIRSDLAELLKRKPHLAKVSRKVDFEGGPRGGKPGNKPVGMDETIRRLARR